MACVGHTVTQGGSRPTSTLCAQKLHLAAVSVCGVDVERVVRAALHAGLAADAAPAVEVHDAVLPPEERGGGTDLDAGRVLAVVAAGDLEGAAGLGEHALLDVLDPGAGDAERDLVLGLAGHRAGVAADAPPVVDQEGVVHARRILS